MRWHKRLLLLTAAGILAVSASACAGGQVRGSQGTAPNTTAPSGTAQPAGDATFVYAPHLEVVTEWDPASSYSNEIIAMQNIYESLTRYNPQTQKPEPRLATSWESSDDGKKWTFTLRSGVKFHTGNTLDAEAAKAAIERTKKINEGAGYIWDAVDKIEAKDPTTLVFELKYAAPLDLIASSGYAAYIYDVKATDGDLKKWFAEGKDAGTGPYTIDTWEKGKEVELTLKAFDEYWGGWEGPHYKKIAYRVTPELTTAWQLLQRGEVSFVQRLNPQLFEQAGNTQGVKTSQTPSFQNLLLLFNTADGPLKDVRVRQALQKAIDYDGLVAALKGSAVKANGLVPQGLLGHDPQRQPAQDLSGATELLKQAGYGPGGKELTLKLTYAQGDDDQKLLVTLLTSTLKSLNVTLDAKPLAWETQWDQGKSKDAAKRQDVFVMYWWPDYADPFSWFVNIFRSADPVSFNLSYLEDKDIDKAIDALPELTATDRDGAQRSYQDLQRRIIDEQAAAAVPYVQNYQRAFSANADGYVDNPAYPNVVFVHDLKPTA
jgi:peptide/nickel transport system substrate-binding protein